MVKNLAMFLVIYYVFKKASKPLQKIDRNKWMKRVCMVFIIGIPSELYMLYKIESELKKYEIEGIDKNNLQ